MLDGRRTKQTKQNFLWAGFPRYSPSNLYVAPDEKTYRRLRRSLPAAIPLSASGRAERRPGVVMERRRWLDVGWTGTSVVPHLGGHGAFSHSLGFGRPRRYVWHGWILADLRNVGNRCRRMPKPAGAHGDAMELSIQRIPR